MIKNTVLSSLKVIITLVMLLTTVEVNAQFNYSNNTQFKAFNYGDMLAPLQMATEAYKKAEQEYEEYQLKFTKEVASKSPNYHIASLYCDKCIKLNAVFKGSLGKWGDLIYQKGYCAYYSEEYEEAYKFFEMAYSKHGNSKAQKAMEQCKIAMEKTTTDNDSIIAEKEAQNLFEIGKKLFLEAKSKEEFADAYSYLSRAVELGCKEAVEYKEACSKKM